MNKIKKIKAPIGDENRLLVQYVQSFHHRIKKIKAPIGDENRVKKEHDNARKYKLRK